MKLRFVGDVVLSDTCFDLGSGAGNKLRKVGFSSFLKDLPSIDADADLAIANLEFVVSDYSCQDGARFNQFRLPEKLSNRLSELGFNCWNVANNHILDHGEDAFHNSARLLRENSLAVIGEKNKKAIFDFELGAVGVFSFSTKYDGFHIDGGRPYNYLYFPAFIDCRSYDALRAALDAEAARLLESAYFPCAGGFGLDINVARRSLDNEIKLYDIFVEAYCSGMLECSVFAEIAELSELCDFLVIYVHWGDEYVNLPAPWQRNLARKLTQLGAGLIVGCHSHSVQGVEYIGDSFVAYSLGNYFFNSNNPAENLGLLLDVEVDRVDDVLKVSSVDYKFLSYSFKNRELNFVSPLENEQYVEWLGSISDRSVDVVLDDYILDSKAALLKSRDYKKKMFLSNIYRAGFWNSLSLVSAFLARRLKWIFSNNI